MTQDQLSSRQVDASFTGPLHEGTGPGGWTILLWPGSGELFGTNKPIKVAGTMDGHDFQATLLPMGGGTHMVPIKAALRKVVGKSAGDQVTVHVKQRFS